MSDADEALVVLAQAGDRLAFEELVRRTSRLLFARLYLETGNTHRAEDLLQETWLRAFRALRRLSSPGSLRSWLLTIAQNVLTDDARGAIRLKRAGPTQTGPEALANHADSLPSPEEELALVETRAKVLSVLRSLPEEYRLPLTLRYIDGADYETIEIQLGLSNGSLRGLLHRGLKMLRARLGPELGMDVGNESAGPVYPRSTKTRPGA